jgi:hypothetical protein
VRSVADPLAEFGDQARLADPGLAHHQRQLTLALAHTLPAAEEQPQLLFAPDEWR